MILTLDSRLLDVGHVLSVRELSKERGGSDDDVDSIDTCEKGGGREDTMSSCNHRDQTSETKAALTGLNGNSGVIHVASNVSQNPGEEAKETSQLRRARVPDSRFSLSPALSTAS